MAVGQGFAGGITDAVLQEMSRGLRTRIPALADQICTIYDKTSARTGKMPNLNRSFLLGRQDNVDLPPGVAPKPHRGSAGDTDFDCKDQVGYFFVKDADVQQFDTYDIDFTQECVDGARRDANLAVDAKLVGVLESTTLNEEWDVTSDGLGPWDDGGSASRPLSDLTTARRSKAPMANCLVYGTGAEQLLLDHPDLTAEFSNYSGGQLDEAQLPNLLARKLNIPVSNIFLFDRLYDNTDRGLEDAASATWARLFEFGVWFGFKEDLVMVDPRNPQNGRAVNNITELERHATKRATDVVHTRVVDIIRPNKEHGVYFSNISS